MTINLPLDTILEPQYRFMYRKKWDGQWQQLPQPTGWPYRGGFFLEEFSRATLPEYGEMTFRYDLGNFENIDVGVDSSQTPPAESALITLVGYCIRLDMAPGSNDPTATPAWAPVWLGVVEYQEDQMAPGASRLLSSRRYYCLDLLYAMTRRWPIRKHGYYNQDTTGNDVFYPQAEGHPGFNSRGPDGRILSNKSAKTYNDLAGTDRANLPWVQGDNLTDYPTFLRQCVFHTLVGGPGSTTPWSDLDVIKHILAMNRPPYSPFFVVGSPGPGIATTDLFNIPSFGWQVTLGETVWDLLARICDRRRARGVVFLDFATSGNDVAVYLNVFAQTPDNIVWSSPITGASQTIFGATEQSSSVTVDLVGDHRNVAEAFRLGDAFLNVYDEVETLGEQIQVLANLDLPQESLTKQWSASEETVFKNTAQAGRIVYRFDKVFQLFGLNPAWDGTIDDGNQTGQTRIDYRCSDACQILHQNVNGTLDTSPDTITTLSDLPLFTDYDYTASPPARYDGASSDIFLPDRRPMMILYNEDDKGNYSRADERYGMSVRLIGNWRFEISISDDMANGIRKMSPASLNVGGGLIDPARLIIVAGLELPHRVRLRQLKGSKTPATDGQIQTNDGAVHRKQTVVLPGLHLWIAPSIAIWDLDRTKLTGIFVAALRNAANQGLAYGILRDDRDRMATFHALACQWYLTERRTVTWALRDCGFLPNFSNVGSDGSTSAVAYPTIGQCLTTLAAGGMSYNINAPITKMHYTNIAGNGITTWICAWSDADFSS